tara:strand:- start:407 stop:622 length:216 start_codon:yes stop_codon:yes gene_type:complete
MRCIAINKNGKYLTARRATGNFYQARSGWSDSIDDAKIFATKGAAANSAKQSGEPTFEIHKIEIRTMGAAN